MAIHGCGEQYWMTKHYEDKRNLAFEKRSRYDDQTLDELDISFPDGGGETYYRTFDLWVYSFPIKGQKKKIREINVRSLPNYG